MNIHEFIKILNANQGVLAAIPIIGGLIFWFFRKRKKDSIHNNSPHISAGQSISAGGDITVGHHNSKQTIIQNEEIPEIQLQLYGSGANKIIEGLVEKKGDKTLILESVEIKGIKTKLNQQFTKLTYIKNLNFSESLFSTKEPQEIKIRVVYKTLDNKRYELTQSMSQTNRADGLFNLPLTGAPSIRKVE